MSENANNAPEEAEGSAVDFALGGEESHSPEQAPKNTPPAEPEQTPVETDHAPEDGEETPESTPDSANKPEATTAAEPPKKSVEELEQENAILRKRVSDTQRAMHEATTERAKLQKELDELKAKEEDDDDWFGEDDKARKEELEGQLKASDEKIDSLNQEAALAAWDAAAAPVIAEHPDFNELVYGKLAPKIDAEKGDPEIRALWEAEADKSPANAYKFAKNLDDIVLQRRDPAAYREKVRKEVEEEYKKNHGGEVTGKEGLDLMNSADTPVGAPDPGGESAVDYVFK